MQHHCTNCTLDSWTEQLKPRDVSAQFSNYKGTLWVQLHVGNSKESSNKKKPTLSNYLLEHIYKSTCTQARSEKFWGRKVMAGVKWIRVQCIFLCSFSLGKQKSYTNLQSWSTALISYSTGMILLNNTTCFYVCSLCVLKHRSDRPSPVPSFIASDLSK